MAEKWGNHESSYKDAETIIKKYAAKLIAAQVDLFLKHYKTCQPSVPTRVRNLTV